MTSEIYKTIAPQTTLEPSRKRKLSIVHKSDNNQLIELENRLASILSCVSCFELPNGQIYQCTNGHLLCTPCLHSIIVRAKMKNISPMCAELCCFADVSEKLCKRNLAIENAVLELSARCQFCWELTPRYALRQHEKTVCDNRSVSCKYARIGCQWQGPWRNRDEHEKRCSFPNLPGYKVMETIQLMDAKAADEESAYEQIFDLLQCEQIAVKNVSLESYRGSSGRLYYDTAKFSAFSLQWMLKALIREEDSSITLLYKIKLKSKIMKQIHIHHLLLKANLDGIKIVPNVCESSFSEAEKYGEYEPLGLANSDEYNRLLAGKNIDCVLIMFLTMG